MFNDHKKSGNAGFQLPMSKRVEAADCYQLLAPDPDVSLREAVEHKRRKFIELKSDAACSSIIALHTRRISPKRDNHPAYDQRKKTGTRLIRLTVFSETNSYFAWPDLFMVHV